VVYRALTVQHAVERDEQGPSNHSMCAVNPSCIGKTFDDAATSSRTPGILLDI
jgi:fatty acid synthase subunit beta